MSLDEFLSGDELPDDVLAEMEAEFEIEFPGVSEDLSEAESPDLRIPLSRYLKPPGVPLKEVSWMEEKKYNG